MTDNTPLLAVATPQIKSEEGCRLHAYPDPLSGGEPYTVGWGSTGSDIGPSTVWTQAQADDDLQSRLEDLCDALDGKILWWRGMSLLRQAVLLSMAYNLGTTGLMGFPHMLACAQAGNYVGASEQMMNSQWARQVPNRAKRLSQQMATGLDQYA